MLHDRKKIFTISRNPDLHIYHASGRRSCMNPEYAPSSLEWLCKINVF